MVARQFIEGEKFQWKERGWVVERRLSDGRVVIRHLGTGAMETHNREQLENELFDGRLKFHVPGREARPAGDAELATEYRYIELNDCPADIAEQARLRYRFIAPLLMLNPKERTRDRIVARINEFWDELSPDQKQILGCHLSVRTFQRWSQLLSKGNGDPRALISHESQRGGKKKSRLDSQVDKIIDDVINRYFLRRTPAKLTPIHDEICLRIDEENQRRMEAQFLKKPGRATVWRRIKELAPAHVVSKQKGWKAGQETTRQVQRFAIAEYPNECWEIDGTECDVLIVDPKDNLALGRPTLIMCIDQCTKVVVGFAVRFNESYLAVAECLYNAIRKGPSSREQFGTVNVVNLYGVPKQLVYDRGKAVDNQHLEDSCGLLTIGTDSAPAYKPEHKPYVERFMGTINGQLFHIAPGTTFANVFKRESYNSQKLACLYLDELVMAIHIYLADIYHQESHDGLGGRTPAQVLADFVQGGFEPRLPPSDDELSILLGQVTYRHLTKSGFTFMHLQYNHRDLGPLRARLADNQKVKIKYHADDLRLMYVYDPYEEQYIVVPALDQEYASGMSLWKHRLLVAQANLESNKVDRAALAQARRSIEEMFRVSRDRKRAYQFRKPQAAVWRQSVEPYDSELDDRATEPLYPEIVSIMEENARKITGLEDAHLPGEGAAD